MTSFNGKCREANSAFDLWWHIVYRFKNTGLFASGDSGGHPYGFGCKGLPILTRKDCTDAQTLGMANALRLRKSGTLKYWYGVCVDWNASVLGLERDSKVNLETVILREVLLFRETKMRIVFLLA